MARAAVVLPTPDPPDKIRLGKDSLSRSEERRVGKECRSQW